RRDPTPIKAHTQIKGGDDVVRLGSLLAGGQGKMCPYHRKCAYFQKVTLEFYIDIHAHSTMMNGFMYGNIFEDEERFQRQAIFPKLLCQNAEDFSFSSTSFNRDAVKAGTGRRFLGGLLDDTSYCYTLEVSFYSYIVGGTASAVPYTEETYMKLGRNVARTFLDYYRLNAITERPLAPISST
ncbi:hypothetical protein JRQ81_014924, partial [Phrynocephalus forsythii]